MKPLRGLERKQRRKKTIQTITHGSKLKRFDMEGLKITVCLTSEAARPESHQTVPSPRDGGKPERASTPPARR